jgi:hypothetical protein
MTESEAKKQAELMVGAMVGPNLAAKWWTRPNRAFDGKMPAEMWREDWQRVYDYLINYLGR